VSLSTHHGYGCIKTTASGRSGRRRCTRSCRLELAFHALHPEKEDPPDAHRQRGEHQRYRQQLLQRLQLAHKVLGNKKCLIWPECYEPQRKAQCRSRPQQSRFPRPGLQLKKPNPRVNPRSDQKKRQSRNQKSQDGMRLVNLAAAHIGSAVQHPQEETSPNQKSSAAAENRQRRCTSDSRGSACGCPGRFVHSSSPEKHNAATRKRVRKRDFCSKHYLTFAFFSPKVCVVFSLPATAEF